MKYTYIGIVSGCVGIICLVLLFLYFIPLVKANNYLNDTKQEIKQLKASFRTLSETTRGPYFEKPDWPPEQAIKMLQDTKETTNATRDQLELFEKTRSHVPQQNNIVLTSKHVRAKIIDSEVDDMVAQTEEVLSDYYELIAYLEAVANARAVFEKNIQQINSYSDLNTLIGKSYLTTAMKDELAAAQQKLQAARIPSQYQDTHNLFLSTFDHAINGFTTLNHGLASAQDKLIYAGAATIESASEQYYTTVVNILYSATIASPTLDEVAELTEKLAPFE